MYRFRDVCLDMYIYDAGEHLVKTFRDTNCSPMALFSATDNYTPVFQYVADWDRRDDAGKPVLPGEYYAVARFYILYCPVIKVKFALE